MFEKSFHLVCLQALTIKLIEGRPFLSGIDSQHEGVMHKVVTSHLLNFEAPRRLPSYGIDGIILEDEKVFEKSRAGRHLAPLLHLHQRTPLILPRFRLPPLYLPQVVPHPLPALNLNSHRQRVDEQARHRLDSRHPRRPPRYRRSEHHIPLSAAAPQDQTPRSLHDAVHRHLLAPRQVLQLLRQRSSQAASSLLILRRSAPRFPPFLSFHPQPRRFAEPPQFPPPELLRRLLLLPLQPPDVIPIISRRRQPYLPPFPVSFIQPEHFADDHLPAPAVDQNMMITPPEVVLTFAQPHQCQPQQRRSTEIKSLAPVFFRIAPPSRFLLPLFQFAPVFLPPRQFDLSLYDLHRLLQPFPHKARSQDRMSLNHLLPRPPERPCFQTFHPAAHLIEVGSRFRLVQGVKQQALLHGRQSIDVLHTPALPHKPVQVLLPQTRQRKVRCRVPARLCA